MKIFLHYYNYAKSWALFFSKDPELAFDITQNVYLKLSKVKTDFVFNYESEIKAYLKRAIKNEFINYCRTQKAQITDIEFYKNIISDKIEDVDLSDEMIYALKLISDKLREPFILGCLHDYPYKDIAELLNIPEGTVKNRIFRAKAELKETILEYRKLNNAA